MGMFDKDKEIGRVITSEFEKGEEFVLHSARVADERIQTDLGPARKTLLLVQRLSGGSVEGEPFETNTLASAIADKAEDASEDDFPCVVKWLEVPSKTYGTQATVLQYVREWK